MEPIDNKRTFAEMKEDDLRPCVGKRGGIAKAFMPSAVEEVLTEIADVEARKGTLEKLLSAPNPQH